MKVCSKCKTEKEFSEFHPRKDKFRSQCKNCESQYKISENGKEASRKYFLSKKGRTNMNKYQKEWRKTEDGKDSNKEYKLKYNFGISLDYYKEILKNQNGVCYICDGLNKCGKALAVDHCHTTGKIRGLLCDLCNRGLGMFRDNIEFLEKAIEYLEKK